MAKRNYNIFFHLHTVSGITISVLLFVIFFAGAFALFKDEIAVWEKGAPKQQLALDKINYDKVFEVIKQEYDLNGREVRMVMPDVKNEMLVVLTGSKYPDASKENKERAFFYINTVTYEITGYYTFYSFGELIYRFHFLSPVPYGLYIAGFTAFIFLFAIVTGVAVHWKKIISNFYVFRPQAKLKNIWTDAHTALGMIGLPFQFIFALTSCFLCLSIFVLLPANYFYNNNQVKLLEDLRPMTKSYPLEGKLEATKSFNAFASDALQKWKGFEPLQIYVKNYGDSNMKFQVDGVLNPQQKLLSYGSLTYDVHQNKVEAITSPYQTNYLQNVELTIRKLHFGDFGGYWLKAIYFILAIITCFVIITGVLIWLEARNKKNIEPKKKRYNERVGHIYLSLCLSIYPITSFTLICSKLLPGYLDAQRFSILHWIFYGGWLFISFLFYLKKDHYFTTRMTLWIGAVLSLLAPVLNGFKSGSWIWITAINHQTGIFVTDVLMILIAITTFFVLYKMQSKSQLANQSID